MSLYALRARGGAAVELAVLMLVLVPCIMYTLFLGDVLFYKFDLQETVISTPWDYADLNYRKKSIDTQKKTVDRAAQLTFADHTSAWNTYNDIAYDTDNTEHHQALAAHQCWLAQGAHQISCSFDANDDLPGKIAQKFIPAAEFYTLAKNGGQVSCNAILGVQNYFLPQQLFQWWAKNPLTTQKSWLGEKGKRDAIHRNAKQDPYLFPKLTYALETDSWALNNPKEEDPGTILGSVSILSGLGDLVISEESKSLVPWVMIAFGMSTRGGKLKNAKQFLKDAKREGFLSDQAGIDGVGDSIRTTSVAWKSDPKREFGKHYASGWSDKRHRNTQRSMKDSYLGQDESTW